MAYVKSFLAGLAATLIAAVLSLVMMVLWVDVVYKPVGNGTVSWDLISLARSGPRFIVAGICVFLAGFIWEFRRASAK